jgi:phosphoribosyl 1,2-cyclic phosphodiesterase
LITIYLPPWDALFLTAIFDHAKHMKEFARMGIDIYASQETFAALGVSGHRAHVVKDGDTFQVGESTVRAFGVEHDCQGSLGFLIANGKDRVLFITDTAYCRYLFPGVTHAIIECNYDDDTLDRNVEIGFVDIALAFRIRRSHLSLQRVIDLIQRNEWTGLQEVHLIHLSSANSDAVLFKTEVQKITGCPVYVAGE